MTVEQRDPNKLVPVTLTDAAKAHVASHLKQDNKKYFRLSVKATGCSGLQYVPELLDEVNEEDYCFDGDLPVYVDKESYQYLKGTNIDFIQKDMNQVFSYDNPNEEGACGCGESFTVEKD